MNQTLTLVQWILPIALIFLGWLAGVIFERVVFKRLKELATKLSFQGMN
jgi:uncharacterized membrane protein AbrB (regulator of aidB expression)